jgi:hypothetical protein
MLFKNYQEFIGSFRIDENVQQAKIYLRKKALADKKAKTKKEDETLTAEEGRRAETNPDFIKIKDMLRDNPGHVFAFTKFFFEEGVPFEELKAMYDTIKEYRSVIGNLPMTVDKYADVESKDGRTGFEMLGDDIEKLKRGRVVKKWVDKLYGDIKREYTNASATVKERVDGIAMAFDEFGKESNGTKDLKVNAELQDLFFNKLRRYKNLNEVIQAALSYIKSANNSSISKFFQNIQKVNQKYGELNGAEIVYNENNVLILEVKSYHANKELNSNTSHCIASSSHHWDSYVGADSNYNKQYYIYNFNLPTSDDKSVIGITIAPKGEVRACHTKSDANFSSQIKPYMSKLNIDFGVLAPMTTEEIEKKKKRVIANKEIVKPNLSTEQVKKYYDEGGDPNAGQGKPLINAVAEDNFEKTEYLLDMGAMPNIGGAIKGAKNLKMIKLLVSHGATVTNEIFASVANDYDAVKYLLDENMDPDFEQGLPLRTAAKNGRLDILELLVKRGAKISTRRYMVVKWAAEWAKIDILNWLLDKLEEQNDDYTSKLGDWINWAKTSDKIEDKDRAKVEQTLLARKKK